MNTAHKQKTSCRITKKELCIIEQNFERSWDAIHQDDVHPYIRNLWITHLFNDQNRIDILKFKEKQINKEIRLHLNKNMSVVDMDSDDEESLTLSTLKTK